jgi:mRNA interferase MazF
MNINKGDIWYVDLEPAKGHEYEKKRPVVVVNTDYVNKKSNFELRIIVPIIGWKPNHDHETWLVKIKPSPRNGLTKVSVADPYQIRCVSEERFDKKRIGVLSDRYMTIIEDRILAVLDINLDNISF